MTDTDFAISHLPFSPRPPPPSMKVTLHAEFNCFKEEGMGEDQTEGHIGHEACHFLSPGTYKYYFMVNGQRRLVLLLLFDSPVDSPVDSSVDSPVVLVFFLSCFTGCSHVGMCDGVVVRDYLLCLVEW